jgi:hypothetical protein
MQRRHQRRQIIASLKPSISRNEWFDNCLSQAIKQIKTQSPDFFRTRDLALVDTPPVDERSDQINFSSSYLDQELGIQRIVFYKLPILSRVSRETNLTQFLVELIWAHKK